MTARRSLRGALAGGTAAAVWAAQQPLDKRVFGCRFDDVELLGKLVAGRGAWPLVGTALHVQNGLAFGAAYAQLRPLLPGRPIVQGLAAALAEHLATWPLTRVVDRYHPARSELVALAGNRRAFAQATWRHVLFGALLGGLEHRLNRDVGLIPAGSNGHGDIERAAGTPSPAQAGARAT